MVYPISVIAKPRTWRPWPGIGSKRHSIKENYTFFVLNERSEDTIMS